MAFSLALTVAFALASPLPSTSPAVAAGSGVVSGKVSIVKNGAPQADASNCVVWIEGAHRPPATPGASARAAALPHGEMKSQGKRFVPRVVAVEKNSEVDFPNVDAIYHNVFSVSPSNRFDLGLYRSGGSKAKKFEEAGVVRVYCNIHPQMVGFVLVVDSDFSAVTGPDGSFRFENVPAGTWQVKAWQEEGGESSEPVTVRARAESPITLRLDASGFKVQPHKNKYGKDYPPNAGTDDERY
jgi:plastocyanin